MREKPVITYGNPLSDGDLRQILALQQANLPGHISPEESRSQGFVTVEHDFTLLKAMHQAVPQIIARSGNKVIGYALVMLREFAGQIPVLVPMFDQLNRLNFQGKKLGEYPYYVMGQVCVDKAFRGLGIFDGLYAEHRRQLAGTYHFVVTEVSTRNQRSLRAHQRVGFQSLLTFRDPDAEEWEIILWDWRDPDF